MVGLSILQLMDSQVISIFLIKHSQYVFVWIYVFISLRVNLCLRFLENAKLCSTAAEPFYIPISKEWGFVSLHHCPHFVTCCFSLQSSSNCEVLSHYGFKMHFPNDRWGWISFHMLIDHSYIFFGKMSIQVFCSFFTWITSLFIFEL